MIDVDPSIRLACSLLRDHWPTCKDWTDDQLLNWVGFFNRHRQCAIIMDGETCVGFGAVRFVNTPEQAEADVFANDIRGCIAWVEMVVGLVPNAVPTLMIALIRCIRRVGANVTHLGGHLLKRRRVVLHPFNRYATLVLRRV